MSKFGRNYRLTIQVSEDESIVIEPPFSIDFNVQRSTGASINTSTINIYNLSAETRSRIFKDWFDFSNYRSVTLEAGYGELTTIFKGNIWQAQSARNSTDIITSVVARDGGHDLRTTQTSRTVAEGASLQGVLNGLVGDFPNLTKGVFGQQDSTFQRPVVLDGNTYELMKNYTDDQVFVDLEKVNVLNRDEAFEAEVPLITSDTGLLNTPQRQEAFITVDMMFEPRIRMGQVVEIQSAIAPQFDGQYKVLAVRHSGMISDAVGGSIQSSFELLVGTQIFEGLKIV